MYKSAYFSILFFNLLLFLTLECSIIILRIVVNALIRSDVSSNVMNHSNALLMLKLLVEDWDLNLNSIPQHEDLHGLELLQRA